MRLEAEQEISGRYRLVARIGAGGMAEVWSAEDTMLGRHVALKFLHERFAQDEQFVERFRREASSAAGLQHPNVVGVFDRGEHEGLHYIAMEYVEGASLKDLISRGLTVGEAVEIVRQVLAGARFAHSRGIVHRDLKPQNVLIDSDGRARVADFGIARAGTSEITQTGSVMGTAEYLSPEQAQGMPVTAASDLYSVGVMLYEALTGRVPFQGDSAVAVALKQVSEQPRPPSELNPDVPRALDAVVLRALAKDPANRYASADEFLQALDVAEADPSGAALGDTAAYAPVVAPAGPVYAEPSPEPPRRGFWTRGRIAALAVLLLAVAAGAVYLLTRPDQVSVPSVLKLDAADARQVLEQRGFDVDTLSVENCAAPNTVTEQDPTAGSEVDEGSTVRITVSTGQAVEVPPVKGLPANQAVKRLEARNLLVDTQDRSSGVKPGKAAGTEPQAGQEVACNDTVTLFVSSGPNLVEVPGVIGLQRDVAQAQLEQLGLIVNADLRDADEPAGEVIDQDPSAGSQAHRDDVVTIVVSTGSGSVEMIDVLGQSREAAKQNLRDAGLVVTVQKQDTDDPAQDGRVIDQAPAPGTRLHDGDRVTIVVGRFVEPVPPPDGTTTTP